MEFIELKEEDFEEFALNHPNVNFWQSPDMAHLRKWNGWSNVYVGVVERGKILAATMLSYRKVFLGSSFVQAVRGFLIDYNNQALFAFFHKSLMDYLKKLNTMYFKIDPYVAYRQRDDRGLIVADGFNYHNVVELFLSSGYKHEGFLVGNDNSREPNWMFVTDLRGKSKEQLLKEFDQQTRWSINKTIKLGIKIKELTIDDLDEFKEIMEHTAKRRGFVDHSKYYYEGLFKTFGARNHLRAYVAQLDLNDYESSLIVEKNQAIKELEEVNLALQEVASSKKFNKKKKVLEEQLELVEKKLLEVLELLKQGGVITLAASTFILYGKEVMYLYSGAYDEYMKFNGPYAIQWHMIQEAIDLGFERYNFYGISGDFEKNAEDYGIYEFKKGFTGEVVQLVGDFYYYVKPMKYRMYQSLRKVKQMIK